MNRLTMPRARRPVKARVSRVSASRSSACRYGGEVPASVASSRAEPIWAATAPAASAAAMSSPVADATCGDSWQCGCRFDLSEQCEQGERLPIVVFDEPWWPLASAPCTTSASTPRDAACSASPAEVTVHQTRQPQPLSDSTISRSGQPNVKETTSGRSRAATSSLAVQSSSVQRGSTTATPYRCASPCIRSDVSLERRLVHVVASRTEDVEADRPRRQRAVSRSSACAAAAVL